MVKKQLPLFPAQPASPDEITRHTPLMATIEHFQRFLTREGKSEHTLKAFLADMELLAEFSGADAEVGSFTTTILNDYLDWMENDRGVPCSRKTYARRVTTVKVYFKWLRFLQAIPHDPALAVLQRSGPAPLSNALDPAQIRAVQHAAQRVKKGEDHDFRPEVLFHLLLETGIKKSETGKLTLKDIERGAQSTIIIRHKARNIYKERRIEISPGLLTLIDLYSEQYALKEELFTCTTRNLEYILTDLGIAAEIPFKLSFEVLRWTMAARDWRHGLEEDRIREKLGLSQTSWYETSAKVRRIISRQVEIEQALRPDPSIDPQQ
jgi:integrase/recombinase XerD